MTLIQKRALTLRCPRCRAWQGKRCRVLAECEPAPDQKRIHQERLEKARGRS